MKLMLLLFIMILFLSCRKDPGSVSTGVNPPRQYEWTLDSLTIPNTFQLSVKDIWGSSAQDVYTVGRSSGARGKMFHFDGKSWQPVKLHIIEGGPFNNLHEIGSITGFSPSNIFAAGFKHGENLGEFLGLLIHFDGIQWTEIPIESNGLLCVWGISPDDLWVGGIEGTLMHFDGGNWAKFSIPDSLHINNIKGFDEDNAYALAYSFDNRGRGYHYLLHWDGQKWMIQESFREHPDIQEIFGHFALEVIENDLFSVGYGGVFRKSFNNPIWENIFSSPQLLFAVCGSSLQNLFAAGRGGRAFHYNGTDWYQYKEIEYSDIEYSCCWTDGQEIFIAGDNGSKSIVVHGK